MVCGGRALIHSVELRDTCAKYRHGSLNPAGFLYVTNNFVSKEGVSYFIDD